MQHKKKWSLISDPDFLASSGQPREEM